MELVLEYINQNIGQIICRLLMSLSFVVVCISGISTIVCSSFNDQRMTKFHSKVLKISVITTLIFILISFNFL